MPPGIGYGKQKKIKQQKKKKLKKAVSLFDFWTKNNPK